MERLKKYIKIIFRFLIALFIGNFGVVEKGKVYRSAQAWCIYPIWLFLGLKTVINLSHKPEKDFHDKFEQWFCKMLGIRYVAYDTITPDYNFKEALNELINCERNVALHCQGGQDRTGGLVAVYKREILGKEYTDIFGDWSVHRIPAEGWLVWLIDRWGK